MKDLLILVGTLIVIGFLAFVLFASDYRVHAKPLAVIVPYCWEAHPIIPGFGRYLMCSEIDRYYDA